MTKELPYRTIFNAWNCLSHDPDVWPDDLLAEVMCNRGALEEARKEAEQQLGRHAKQIGAIRQADENGRVTLDDSDPRLHQKEAELMDDTAHVTLRTISYQQAETLSEQVADEVSPQAPGASATDWHWMIE